MTSERDETLAQLEQGLARRRLRPAQLSGQADAARWGELRSLAAHRFEGGERWSEWEPVLMGFEDEAEREAAHAHLARAWGLDPQTERGLDALRAEFQLRVMEAHAPKARRLDRWGLLSQPAAEAQLQAWEQRWSMALPKGLRRFMSRVCAGLLMEDEQVMFNLMQLGSPQEPPLLCPYGVHLRAWSDGDDMTGWQRDALERVLGELEAQDQPRQLWPPLDPEGPRAPQTVESLLILEAFFEGNHGDWQHMLITQGPLAGRMLHGSDVIHSDQDGRGCVWTYTGQRVEDWLYEHLYRQEFLERVTEALDEEE